MNENQNPGLIILLGSGETQASSSKTHEFVAQNLPPNPHISILETPAGFELNSDKVAGRIKSFLEKRLQNYKPVIDVIPARKKGTAFSPDAMDVVAPLFCTDEILLGPGSPTYCTRQLQDSLALEIIRSRHRLGAALLLSSAATVSFGVFSIPVYEIYKVGADPYWNNGLNFFADYGLNIVVVPHWNNNDGGDALDTSHCYIGAERFEILKSMLPDDVTILGIDDHTSVIIDLNAGFARIFGSGTVTTISKGQSRVFLNCEEFPLSLLGEVAIPNHAGIKQNVWEIALRVEKIARKSLEKMGKPPEQVVALVQHRETARSQRNWEKADALRAEIADLGWQVMDTVDGPRLFLLNDSTRTEYLLRTLGSID